MLAVRYIALVALLLWMASLASAMFVDLVRQRDVLALACGGLILVCLFVMKFVGPPPHGFIPRVVLTAFMLVLAIVSVRQPALSLTLQPITIGLGLVALFWYVRE